MYIRVKVKTGQKKTFLRKIKEDTFEVHVREKAEKNLANKKVCELLFSYFNEPDGGVKIINGHHSPIKLLKIGKEV